jgi:hypothetical protein
LEGGVRRFSMRAGWQAAMANATLPAVTIRKSVPEARIVEASASISEASTTNAAA